MSSTLNGHEVSEGFWYLCRCFEDGSHQALSESISLVNSEYIIGDGRSFETSEEAFKAACEPFAAKHDVTGPA